MREGTHINGKRGKTKAGKIREKEHKNSGIMEKEQTWNKRKGTNNL
jgi:hypothetical protein